MESPENSNDEVNNNAAKETISASPESSSRRKFLGKVGGITAVTMTSGAILSGPIAGSGEVLAQAGNAISDEGFEADRDGRVERARRIRIEAANREASLGNFPHPRNGDEERFPRGSAISAKRCGITISVKSIGETTTIYCAR